MPNPLDDVTQDLRDVNGNPLKRVYITKGPEPDPVDGGDVGSGDNRLMRAVAPEPAQTYDVLSLIRQVKDYLTNVAPPPGTMPDVGGPLIPDGGEFSPGGEGFNRLFGVKGERIQTWPERMVRSGVTLPGEVSQGIVPTFDPETGRTSVPMIERAQDTAGLAMPGGLAQKPGTATLGSGPVRQGAAAVPAETAPVFYSALEHTVQNAAQDAMSPQQWQGFLKNQPGVKGEELAWTGVNDWLAQQKGKVSKKDVQAYLDKHKVEIKDVTKSAQDPAALRAEAEDQLISAYGPRDWRRYSEAERQAMIDEHMEGLTGEHAPEGATKYSDYQLPGGENYREHLLTLPTKSKKPLSKAERDQIDSDFENGLLSDKQYEDKLAGFEENAKGSYLSSHWDEPNVLAHVRTNERDVGGQPSLHIEEIQSDWHQQGRKSGYATKDNPEAKPGWDSAGPGKVPDAPFKTAWPELALKRMIRLAADEGKTRISWTPGEAQAARYDLSKSISKIEHTEFSSSGQKGITAYDHKGNKIIDKYVKDEELPDLIGKEAADKLLKAEQKDNMGNKTRALEGLDLKVGGEGMKGFYDNMLPKMVEKLGKAHGVKVQKGEVSVLSPAFGKPTRRVEPIWYFDIPPAWRDQAVGKGFPLYMQGIPFPLTPVDYDPFKEK